ncbi:11662_t:CDS:2 [Gigaspora rosea]|nr:11662_t:CDS:2 [Gigaspora rosea]
MVQNYLEKQIKEYQYIENGSNVDSNIDESRRQRTELGETLYDRLKSKLAISDDIKESFIDKDYEVNDDFFTN